MKLLKSIFVLIMIVSLASCGSDDDNNHYALNNENLAGSYDVVLLETKEVKTTNVSGVDFVTVSTYSGHTFQLEIIFSENGNYLTNGEYVVDYKVEVEDQVVEEDTQIVVVDSEEGTYTANDTSMILVLDGEAYDVTSFNSNGITFELEKTWIEDGEEFVYTEKFKLERQ